MCEKYFAHRFDKIPTKEQPEGKGAYLDSLSENTVCRGVGVMAAGGQGWVRPRCVHTQAAKRKEPAEPAFSSFKPDPAHGMALPKVSMGPTIVNLS